MNGLLVVDKPVGWSSMDVVRRVRVAGKGVKTGHAGTLDPLATGVVVCCLGRATRCVEQIMGLEKTYETVVDLTGFSTTDDLEGELTLVEVQRPPSREDVELACGRFIGEIQQVPPAYSAMRVGGRRAYKLARAGQAVALEPRPVTIYAVDVLAYDWPRLSLRIRCGRGTYIRSLARDLGKALGTGGHLASLRRTAVGPYTLAQAVTIDDCRAAVEAGQLLPMP